MAFDDNDSLCLPLLKKWGRVHEEISKCIWKCIKPLEKFSEWLVLHEFYTKNIYLFWKTLHILLNIFSFCQLRNAALWACGFIAILAPFYVGYFLIVLGLLLVFNIIIAGFFGMIGLTLGIAFVMIGIWPAFILSLSITCITIVTLIPNMYYHALVTYRSVMLRRNLKILSFLLLPITHILVPPFTLIVALITLFPWFAMESFAGFPTGPWKRIRKILNQVWKKFTKDVKKFADNYGHESGIPQDWDGTVYGLAVDPLVVIIAIFVFVIGAIAMTPTIFVIFILKALPIFLETFIQFWKNINLMKAGVWYIGVLLGSHDQGPSNQNTRAVRSPAPGWIKCLKSAIKGIKHGIEGYSKMKICTIYTNILKNHFNSVKALNPSKLSEMISTYCKDLNPTKIIPKNVGCEIVLLWIPILMVFLMWTLGLVLVLTIPPLTFLVGFALWIIFWPTVIAVPPILYIGGWFLIIFGLPILYVLLWCSVIIGPWIFCLVGSLMGPLLALSIPFCMLAYNNYNPINMWDNARRSLVKGYKICRSIDRCTTKYSFFKFRIFCGDNYNPSDDNVPSQKTQREERGTIDYWNLFTQRCIEESKNIQRKKWITTDDILSVSSTATIALPGVAIVAILEDTIKRNQQTTKDKKILIFWNEENKCKHSNQDLTDNIANVFLPQIMRVKESMMALENDELDSSNNWIKAKLCDGEDEKTKELALALEDIDALGKYQVLKRYDEFFF